MIRVAELSDAPDIAALWNDIIANTTITFTTQLKSESEICKIISDPTRLVHIANIDGVFAGFALVGPFRAGPGYSRTVEHTIYLHPQAQGQGVGRALMQSLMSASQNSNHHVMIGALSAHNASAFAFHSKLGFEQVGLLPQAGHKNGAWQDLLLMQKILRTTTDIPGTQE